MPSTSRTRIADPDAPLIYCASPFGFSEAGRLFLARVIKPAFRAARLRMVDPWTLTPQADIDRVAAMRPGPRRTTAWAAIDAVIAANNTAGIRRSAGLFAVLDGVDVDSGTAAEIGFAAGVDLPMVGYRGDFRLSADNEGTTVNLQVEHFIRSSGDRRGTIIRQEGDLVAALRSLRSRIRSMR